ncbi:MAG: hypothetical protein AB1598_05825 [Thermodesulfobacteriota bacterium]
MKALLTALLITFLLTAARGGALADDYFEKAVSPEGADDRSSQVYPAYDFEDVIFTREYFYTLEEGRAQLERSGGTWKTLDFNFGFLGGKSEAE